MFENLTEKLSKALRHITGNARLDLENTKESLAQVKNALLEADVALDVVTHFIELVKEKAIGKEVPVSLTPGQFFIKIIKDELTTLMGGENSSLDLRASPPVIILLAGLQGSGKTTTVAKLAKFLINQAKKVMVVSTDIYRPNAIEQLQIVAKQVGANFFASTKDEDPIHIVNSAIQDAKRLQQDVLIVDTAGRLHIDEEMMAEIRNIHKAISPKETLFVVDSMTGQDAANTAKAFNDALPLTGIILTKIDGDTRGGAALSIRHITGKPIKFLGVGEKLDALEPFYPDRLASRIIGMGDIFSLIEDIERKVDKKEAEKIAKKVSKGGFDLEDLKSQLIQMQNMGGLSSLMGKLPGVSAMGEAAKGKMNDQELKIIIAVINSMTKKERANPNILINKAMKGNGSRKRRISAGSGTTVQDFNKALKMYQQMQKMMHKFSNKGSLMKMMRGLQGKLPEGMLPPNFMNLDGKS